MVHPVKAKVVHPARLHGQLEQEPHEGGWRRGVSLRLAGGWWERGARAQADATTFWEPSTTATSLASDPGRASTMLPYFFWSLEMQGDDLVARSRPFSGSYRIRTPV